MKILIVGGGRMGLVRANFFANEASCEIILVEPDVAARKTFSDAFPNTILARSIAEAAEAHLDGAVICTPPLNHFEAAKTCLEKRIPILLEKPATLIYREAEILVSIGRELGVSIMVGYHNRVRPSVMLMKERLKDVKVLGFAAWWVCGSYARDWWSNPSSSGGGFFEQGCHFVDLISFLFGPISQNNGCVFHSVGASETAALWVNTERGIGGSLFYSSEAAEKNISLRVFTSDGVLQLEGWDLDFVERGVVGLPGALQEGRNAIFNIESAEFLRRIEGGKASLPLASLEEAMLTEAIVRNIRSGPNGLV